MENIFTFIGGILASFIAWLVVSNVLKPHLEIDKKIYKYKSIDNPGYFVYKVKVTNKRLFLNVYDVNLSARVYIYGLDPESPHEFRMYIINPGAKYVPNIVSKKRRGNSISTNERYFTIYPPFGENKEKKKGKLRRLYNKKHEEEPKNEIFTVEDVFNIVDNPTNKTTIEFSVTATSGFSAARASFTEYFNIDSIEPIDKYDNDNSD